MQLNLRLFNTCAVVFFVLLPFSRVGACQSCTAVWTTLEKRVEPSKASIPLHGYTPATPVYARTHTVYINVSVCRICTAATPQIRQSAAFFPCMASCCLSRVLLALVCFVLDRSVWVPCLKLPWGCMCTLRDGLRWDGGGSGGRARKEGKTWTVSPFLRLGQLAETWQEGTPRSVFQSPLFGNFGLLTSAGSRQGTFHHAAATPFTILIYYL